jgi:hypothetical protein
MSLEGVARNEELFRNVNEQIEGVSQTVPASEATIEFLCECDQIDCLEKIIVTRAEYDSVRAVPTHFLVVSDHVDPRVEHDVVSNERFLVVEKEGVAATDAEETDPRADEQ